MLDYRAIIANVEYTSLNDGIVAMPTIECITMSGSFQIGNVCPKRLNIIISPIVEDIRDMDTVDFYIKKSTVVEWEYRGKYYISKRPTIGSDSKMSIEALDELSLLADPFPENEIPNYPLSTTDLLNKIGIPIETQTNIYQYMWTFSDDTPKYAMLKEVATAHAGNIHLTYDNKLRIAVINKTYNSYDIGTNAQIFHDDKIHKPIKRVTLNNGTRDVCRIGASDEHGITLTITNANITMCNNIYDILNGYIYRPFMADKAYIDYSFTIGDNVKIKDNSYVIYNFLTFYSKGTSETASNISAPNEVGGGFSGAVSRLSGVDVVDITTLPILVEDYNKIPIRVEQEEIQIAKIEIEVTQAGKASGGFAINFMSDRESEAIFRIYINEVQHLFTPYTKQIHRGINEVAFPHSYLKLADGVHLFAVTMQTRKGWCNIGVRDIDYNITLFSTDIIPFVHDIRDLTISQPNGALSPISVYVIAMYEHEDENITEKYPIVLNARYREGYRYTAKDFSILWEFANIQAREIAIEFNGIFVRRENEQLMTLATHDKPMIAWIDESDTLYIQYGNEQNTRVELATQVLQVSLCRGWVSAEYPDEDAGLVVTYIKYNGIVAYRRLLGTITGNYIWEYEYVLISPNPNVYRFVRTSEANRMEVLNNTYVHVHRLNDYRMGFAVSGINNLIVTNRFFIQSTVPTELIGFNFETYCPIVGIIPIENADYDAVTIESSVAENWLDLYVKSNYPLILRRPFEQAFNIISNVTGAKIISMTEENGALHLRLNRKPLPLTELTLKPVVGVVAAVYFNGSLLSIPSDNWVFIFTKQYENISFNFSASGVAIIELMVQEISHIQPQDPIENISFNFSASGVAIIELMVQEISHIQPQDPIENISFNFSASGVAIIQEFVGEIPI